MADSPERGDVVSAREADTAGVVGALIALAVGIGAAAIVDFGGVGGQGLRVGLFVLALGPWVLALTGRSGARPLHGSVSLGWVLLLAGAVGALAPARGQGPLGLAPIALQAGGAAAVLVVLHRAGHFGSAGLFARLGGGVTLGVGLGLISLRPLGSVLAAAVCTSLIAAHLVPQLVHDALVVQWGRRHGAWDRARAALQGVSMPFILWTVAGHLLVAPGLLYWSPKPQVALGGFGAAVALALFVLRGMAGLYAQRSVLIVTTVAIIYGVGLAAAVVGDRPVYPLPGAP